MTATTLETTARPAYGTLAWARAANGRLSRREQLREVGNLAATVLSNMPRLLRAKLGHSDRDALSFDLDKLVFPDSKVALEAETECRDCTPVHVLNHCYRSYAFAMLLAQRDGLTPDPELIFVTSMLHDLAWSDRYRYANTMPCFGARGGLVAHDWAAHRGWPEDRCERLGDAISLHLNVKVGPEYDLDARAFHAGVTLDVSGARYWQLARTTVDAVVDRYPRDAWRDARLDFRRECRPRTRAKLLARSGLFMFANAAPFDDPIPFNEGAPPYAAGELRHASARHDTFL